jgi:hypothetical protein
MVQAWCRMTVGFVACCAGGLQLGFRSRHE